ncbi:hypothetical protein W02_13560 [Nitrospira sp. KM1]|nr:hypothetical protein W02_13560 [Nitrospira sp. KM1]
MGPRHALHADIAGDGKGRYSHWGSGVIFASSDNSDPRSNGRRYGISLADPKRLNGYALPIAVEALVELNKTGEQEPVLDFFLNYTRDTTFFYHDPLFDSKEHVLCELLKQQSSIYGGSVGVIRTSNTLQWWLTERKESLKDKIIVEIGPGRSAALGLLLLMAGARTYIGLDAFPSQEWWNENLLRSVWRMAREFYPWMDTTRGLSIINATDSERNAREFPLQFAVAGVNSYPLQTGSVDQIFSFSVLEHVEKPAEAIAEMHRILSPGGLMLHSVDLASHEPFKDTDGPYNPFAFLAYSDEEWRKRWTPSTMKYYQNRWRKVDFLKAFDKQGFCDTHALSEQDVPVVYFNDEMFLPKHHAYRGITPEIRETFAPRFQALSNDDLGSLVLFVSCRK